MELKKTPQADLDQQRTTGFLLGAILVLSLLFVALEWNSIPATDDDDAFLDLDELIHEDDLVPMSVERQMADMQPSKAKAEESEQVRIVDDNVEVTPDEKDDPDENGDKDGKDDETAPVPDVKTEDPKVLTPVGIDPNNNPLQFRIVEDLPQFPGGAVEFMKWLTKNLTYPPAAQSARKEGKVVAVFYVEKDGSVTHIAVTKSLSRECDEEALRVLRLMPKWKPGVQNGRPCRTKVCIPVVFKL